MVYLYRKKCSPFWYVQYVDSVKIRHDKSTNLRTDERNDTVKAKVLRAELEAEYQGVPRVNGAAWDTWVIKFLERHRQTEATAMRYGNAWRWLSLWRQRQRINSPRQLTCWFMALSDFDGTRQKPLLL